ncbi:hypothetical protein ACFO26_05880 [Lactococcus nasutitermitis]|uniref:DUF4315 family protein n=1 Tax=Lactococcus nasutitermitis TaxID=1652957 RepID=A0ABV9JEF7_9LACT
MEELEKKRLKKEQEYQALKEKAQEASVKATRKKEELEAVNSSYIAEILVTNKITMSEFLQNMPEMLELVKGESFPKDNTHKTQTETDESKGEF